MLTLERLRRLLSYNPETGELRRRAKTARTPAGALAGYVDVNGYRCLNVDGRPYKAHRLVWFYMTGVMPIEYVDHINGNKADNRFANLRLASNSQNQANRGAPCVNTSGVKGIRFQPERGKWIAMITVRGKQRNLGRYETKEAAEAAYLTASQNAFGSFVYGATLQRVEAAAEAPIAGAIEYPEVTQDELDRLFNYDPSTGHFTRRAGRQGQAKAGDTAGSTEWTGYRNIKIRGKRYPAHHLAWLYVHGYLPSGEIDHINGIRDDNRITNLREGTRRQNLANTRGHFDSVTGRKGVSFDPRCVRKFYARIKIDGKTVNLGHFLTAEDAAAAYDDAAREAFGEFAKSLSE